MSLWDLSTTLVTTILIIGLTAKGYLPDGVAAFMLIVFVAFKAWGRAKKGIKGFIYYSFMAIFYLILVIFMALKGGWKDIVITLIGAFSSGFEEIIAKILGMAFEGHIGICFAFLAVAALVLLRWLGLQIASKVIYHLIFSIGVPIFLFITFAITASSGNWQEAALITGSLFALVLMLEGFYIMSYGFFSSRQK